MDDINRLKKLSGLNEGNYGEEAMQNLDRIASQILNMPEEIINYATNLGSEAEMNDVLEYLAKQLEAAAAKLRS